MTSPCELHIYCIEKIEEETQRLSLLKLTNPTQIVYMINLFLRICYEKNYYY